jgi:hypothetical protein
MATDLIRTPADDAAAAVAALDRAFCEMRNWYSHLEQMAAHPEDRDAIAFQARRSARIVSALLEEAVDHASCGQLRSVS